MKYDYASMGNDQFERLTVSMCQFLLGASVQGFATGVDGGKDAKFHGTAQHIPSTAKPWDGKVIIQAKHTLGFNKKFTDPDFFSPKSKSCVLAKEIPRINKMIQAKELDYYMLFSNRRLTGNGDGVIKSHLEKETGLQADKVLLCGLESIDPWLKRWPQAAEIAELDPIDCPLIVSPEELAEVIEAMSANIKDASIAADTPENRTNLKSKNQANGLSDEFSGYLVKKYLKYTLPIKQFLAHPVNEKYKNLYLSAVEEFNLNVMAKKGQFTSFDAVIAHLFNILINRDSTLRKNKMLTCTMVFYMYWNCDLGVNSNAPA